MTLAFFNRCKPHGFDMAELAKETNRVFFGYSDERKADNKRTKNATAIDNLASELGKVLADRTQLRPIVILPRPSSAIFYMGYVKSGCLDRRIDRKKIERYVAAQSTHLKTIIKEENKQNLKSRKPLITAEDVYNWVHDDILFSIEVEQWFAIPYYTFRARLSHHAWADRPLVRSTTSIISWQD